MKKLLILSVFIVVILTALVNLSMNLDDEIHLVAVGDILLSRGVGEKIDKEGFDYPYKQVKEIFLNKEIVFGNLEGPIYEGEGAVYKRPDLIFKGLNENGMALNEAGFNVINLANNHTMDYNSTGLINTMKILDEQSIDYVGAGKDYIGARKLVVVEKKGCKIGFLAYSIFPPEGFIFSEDKVDVARVSNSLRSEMKLAKERCDLLVVSFHWGNEYNFYPSENQKNLAYEAIDGGADLILGHHPHVLQGIEKYMDKYIFYSLGNFIFDRQIQKGTDETVIIDLTIRDKSIEDIRLIPIKIIECQPVIAMDDEVEYILRRLEMYSKGMNSQISIDNGIGNLR